jgi:CVNH domain
MLLSATMFDLKDDSILQGLCQRTDGKWDFAEIDLNNHYGNKQGKFESDGSGFKHTSRNFKVEANDAGTSVLFQAELARPDSGGWVPAEVELSAEHLHCRQRCQVRVRTAVSDWSRLLNRSAQRCFQ